MEFPNKGVGKPAAPPPKAKIEPVVTGAQLIKRPVHKRLQAAFFADSPKNLTGHISRTVIVPRLKAGLQEVINGFVAGVLWGNTGQSPMIQGAQRAMLRGPHTPYSQQAQQQGMIVQQVAQASPYQSTGNYQDVRVPSVAEAETLLANVLDRLQQYSLVTVGDLYEFADIKTAISDNAYGWYSLEGARIMQDGPWFVLMLPKPTLL